MTDEVRKRAACDRCHAQKVRCPKRPEQEFCDRCVKAQSDCVFSPFRQKKTPEEGHANCKLVNDLADAAGRDRDDQHRHEHASSRQNGEARLKRKRLSPQPQIRDNIGFEWSTMCEEPHHQMDPACDWISPLYQLPNDFQLEADLNPIDFDNLDIPFTAGESDPFTYQDRRQIKPVDSKLRQRIVSNMNRSFEHTSKLLLSADENSSLEGTLDPGSPPSIWTRLGEDIELEAPSHCVKKLSQLSIELFEHSKTIPPQSIHDPLAPENDDGFAAQSSYANYAVEDTFRLTQAMIDLYPSFLTALTGQEPAGMSGAGMVCLDKTRTLGSANESIDHASILLILSCHLRLIDIYDELFKHMQVCIDQRGKAKLPQQAMLTAPQLRIGSYVPPPSTTVPMQMLLILQFASQLYNYASDLAAEIPGSTPSGSSSASSSNGIMDDQTLLITKAAAENVKDRAGLMSEKLGHFRGKMLSSGLLV